MRWKRDTDRTLIPRALDIAVNPLCCDVHELTAHNVLGANPVLTVAVHISQVSMADAGDAGQSSTLTTGVHVSERC